MHGSVLDEGISLSLLPSDVCWVVSCLLAEDSGLVLRTRYQAATQQLAKEVTVSQQSSLLAALQAKDFSFRAELKCLRRFAIKKKKKKWGKRAYLRCPLSLKSPIYVFWGISKCNLIPLQQLACHLRTLCYPCLGSAVLYSLSSAHYLENKSLLCVTWNGVSMIVAS